MQLMAKQPDGSWSVVDETLPSWDAASGLIFEVDVEIDAIPPDVTAIGIDFPAFTDGRGLSLAVLIRTRLNFQGELYALGGIHQDIVHYLARCGFSKILVPDGCSAATALTLIQPYSDHYQSSVIEAKPSFKRVERG